MHWRSATANADAMRGTGDDQVLYAAGWALSGAATLCTIVAVWALAI